VGIKEAETNANLAQQQTSQLAQSAYQSFVNALKVDAEITSKIIAEPTQIF
jgi:peptidyl-prolyl cis-trans isomerase D